MSRGTPIQAYSRRLLSPFRGMLQVIEVPSGVAESCDGVRWKLFVADETIVSHTGLSEIQYGSWSARTGSTRAKVRGTCASRLIEQTGERLLTALETFAGDIPFPPMDIHELWLLDALEQAPLALLETAVDPTARCPVDNPRWLPGAAAKTEFVSPRGNSETLARLLARTAGKRPRALWVERVPIGAGVTSEGVLIPAERFPGLFIRTTWDAPDDEALVQDFLDWQAPWLLQLADLAPDARGRLERAAWRRPHATSGAFRLYPRLMDREGLQVTRVKARLLLDSARPGMVSEPFYPFYVE